MITSKTKLIRYFMLASADRRSENVGVMPIIITELKLGDIQRQIFAADFVVTANNAALQDRPKAFDCIGVNCADDMLTDAVIDNTVRISLSPSLL